MTMYEITNPTSTMAITDLNAVWTADFISSLWASLLKFYSNSFLKFYALASNDSSKSDITRGDSYSINSSSTL
jgi:hypothetical protein